MGESCRVARLHDGRNLSPAGDLRAHLAGERGKQNTVAEIARGHELTGAISAGTVPEDGQVVRGSGAGADVRLQQLALFNSGHQADRVTQQLVYAVNGR